MTPWLGVAEINESEPGLDYDPPPMAALAQVSECDPHREEPK